MTNRPNSARLLGTRRHGVFWFASLLSNIGAWMQSVAEPWLLLSIGGSSFLLGLDAFAMNAPFWILLLDCRACRYGMDQSLDKPALALNSMRFNLSRVTGPAIAGLVTIKYGFLWCFGANAASYIPFFLSIYWRRPRQQRWRGKRPINRI